MELSVKASNTKGLPREEIAGLLREYFRSSLPRGKILVLPPDHSRVYSGGGMITNLLWDYCREAGLEMDMLPALGTHEAMDGLELCRFFGSRIPPECFRTHDWRNDVCNIGEVPARVVQKVSSGLLDMPIAVEVNKRIVSGEYTAIVSIGQVVPHEVTGFSNYTKNILIGAGGGDMINKSHYLGAVVGMENILGRVNNPVRAILDYVEEHILQTLSIRYIFTVTTNDEDTLHIHGIYAGRSRMLFEEAAELSGKKNITYVDKPVKKCLVYLDPREFKSTWIGNKAIYRTRMALADGGELIILAPGIDTFGEDRQNDRLIRKYGYVGREASLRLTRENQDLRENLSVAGQIIQGSSEGRFRVVYCTKHLTKAEVERAGFAYMEYEVAAAEYDIKTLRPGVNIRKNGEEIYFIPNPAMGLWSCRSSTSFSI